MSLAKLSKLYAVGLCWPWIYSPPSPNRRFGSCRVTLTIAWISTLESFFNRIPKLWCTVFECIWSKTVTMKKTRFPRECQSIIVMMSLNNCKALVEAIPSFHVTFNNLPIFQGFCWLVHVRSSATDFWSQKIIQNLPQGRWRLAPSIRVRPLCM